MCANIVANSSTRYHDAGTLQPYLPPHEQGPEEPLPAPQRRLGIFACLLCLCKLHLNYCRFPKSEVNKWRRLPQPRGRLSQQRSHSAIRASTSVCRIGTPAYAFQSPWSRLTAYSIIHLPTGPSPSLWRRALPRSRTPK